MKKNWSSSRGGFELRGATAHSFMPTASRTLRRLLLLAASACPASAHADCNGFLNQTEQGFKLEGTRLEPSGPKVAAGTELEFNGMAKVQGRLYLTRARSDVIFDAENVELTASCDLPTRPAPQAR